MSEYQYYEFTAIDRPLTEDEMRRLRTHSTRARITSTSFVNEYSWGSFKGNEKAWMELYFDAFLYLANWGSHVFMLRLPSRLLPLKTASLYCRSDWLAAREKNGKVILTFTSEDEEGGEWVNGDGCLSSLIALRSELARGDLRCLYLGWLLSVQTDEIDENEFEPPVPAGLADLSASLRRLVDFLRIDPDILHFAAQASAPLLNAVPNQTDVAKWLANMPNKEKNNILRRLVLGSDGSLVSELVQQVMEARDDRGNAATRRRTVREILVGGDLFRSDRTRMEAEKAAKDKLRREREKAVARAKHLRELASQELALWKEVEKLIESKLPINYDRAVGFLVDLRDLALEKNRGDFRPKIEALRAKHARKPSLIGRLQRAGL